MSDYTIMLLDIVLSVAVVLTSRYVIPALKSYVKKQENQEIFEVIETAVKAAEQTIKEYGKGQLKKEKVVDYVSDWLDSRGIKMTEEELDVLIEKYVYMLNNPE